MASIYLNLFTFKVAWLSCIIGFFCNKKVDACNDKTGRGQQQNIAVRNLNDSWSINKRFEDRTSNVHFRRLHSIVFTFNHRIFIYSWMQPVARWRLFSTLISLRRGINTAMAWRSHGVNNHDMVKQLKSNLIEIYMFLWYIVISLFDLEQITEWYEVLKWKLPWIRLTENIILSTILTWTPPRVLVLELPSVPLTW